MLQHVQYSFDIWRFLPLWVPSALAGDAFFVFMLIQFLRAMEEGPALTEFAYTIENPRQEVTHDAVRVDSHVRYRGA